MDAFEFQGDSLRLNVQQAAETSARGQSRRYEEFKI